MSDKSESFENLCRLLTDGSGEVDAFYNTYDFGLEVWNHRQEELNKLKKILKWNESGLGSMTLMKLENLEEENKILREAVKEAIKELDDEHSPVSTAQDILEQALEKITSNETGGRDGTR